MDIKEIFEKIKNTLSIENDVLLAEKLGVKYNTLQTWQKRNSIPYELLISFSQKYNLDLNYVFGNYEIAYLNRYVSNLDTRRKNILGLSLDAALESDDINGLFSILEEYYLFTKIRSKFKDINNEQTLWIKIISGIRQKNTLILILGKVLSALDDSIIDKDNIKEEQAKNQLLEFVNKYQLKLIEDNIKHILGESEKKGLIDWINKNLSNFDSYIILRNIPMILEVLREEINTLNKSAF